MLYTQCGYCVFGWYDALCKPSVNFEDTRHRLAFKHKTMILPLRLVGVRAVRIDLGLEIIKHGLINGSVLFQPFDRK